MIDFNKYESWALDLVQSHWRDLLPLLLGPLSALCLMAWVESYIPQSVNDAHTRLIKTITLIGIPIFSCASIIMLWGILDSSDALQVRVTVSIIWSPIALLVYPSAMRYVSNRYPAIGKAIESVWASSSGKP